MATRSRSFQLLMGALSVLSAAMTAGADGGVAFEDIASQDGAGVHYRRVPSATKVLFDTIKQQPLYTLGDVPLTPIKARGAPGVAVFDYDGDGDLDIYVTNGPGAANSLYSNRLRETGQVAFVDVATAAGVDVSDQDCTGTCFGDIDNDGDHDLFVLIAGGPNRLFENLGDGTFTDITDRAGVDGGYLYSASCAMGDVNGDGLLDIVVANSVVDWDTQLSLFVEPFALNVHNQLLLNRGDNVFEDVSAASGIENLAGMPPGAAGLTWAISMVDYDMDGDVDIIAADDQAATPPAVAGGVDRGYVHVFQNDGTGRFTNVTLQVGTNKPGQWMGLAFGDLNADGHMDMFVSNFGDYSLTLFPVTYNLGDASSRWFLGQPDGTFADPGVGGLVATPFGWGTAVTDYDNDADLDIIFHGGLDSGAFIEASNPGAILQNINGSAQFRRDATALANSTNHSRRTIMGMAVGDLNEDGFIDIVSVSNMDTPEQVPLIPINASYGGPFDSDAVFVPTFTPVGDPGEFVFTFSGIEPTNGTLSVELSSGDNDNSWVQVELLGTKGLIAGGRVNRDGIGAVVTVTPRGGRPVMQPILGGASYASQSSLIAQFGLGKANRSTVDVLWPGGVRNRLYHVHQNDRIVFPEIPYSYDDLSVNAKTYRRGVFRSVVRLVKKGVLSRREAARFYVSALKARRQHARQHARQ